ncbi:MAG: carotenoid oxygenase family protein [Bacteroidota bacterium]
MELLKTYFSATRKVETEYQNHKLSIQGELPPALQGTLFRNGNGCFEHQGVQYHHLFDGDGMITKFEFKDGKIRYSNRYVRTKEFVEENEAGKMLYRSFGTNLPGGPLKNMLKMRFKNAANTSVIWHGGKMLALWEGGLPHEIDPVTLETVGRYDYEGVLINDFSAIDKWINPELPFSAHPKLHEATGVLHNFGTAAGAKQRLVLYEVQADGTAAKSQIIPMEEVTFTHDFVLTQNGRKIFFLTPVSFDLLQAFSGLQSPVASIRVDHSKKTKVIVVDADQTVHELEMDFCFVFHFANGYDVGEDKVVIDGYIMEDFPSAEAMKTFLEGEVGEEDAAPMLTRFELDLSRKQVKTSNLSPYPGELPNVAPTKEGRLNRYIWNIAGTPETTNMVLHGVAKVDAHERQTMYKDLKPHLPGEPIFVPRPNPKAEDDGWILMLLFDTIEAETRLLVLEADTLEEVASAKLPHNIPLGFHGMWLDQHF